MRTVFVLAAVIAAVLLCGIWTFAQVLAAPPPVLVVAVFFGLDIPVALLLASVILAIQRPNAAGAVFATIIPIALIAASSWKFQVLAAPAMFDDVWLLPDLRRTLPASQALMIDLCFTAACLIFAVNLRFDRRTIVGGLLVTALAVSAAVIPGSASLFPAIADRLPARVVAFPLYGHFVNAALVSIEQTSLRRVAEQLAEHDDAPGRLVLPPSSDMRSVHVVIAESLVDPYWFSALSWSGEPLSDLFANWRQHSDGRALAPVFGNRSSNTEFEVLCGVPASVGAGSVVFLSIPSNASLPCLPRILAARGYSTVSLVPNAPAFFEAGRAFRAMGFAHRVFGPDIDLSDTDGAWLSAAATLRETSRLIKSTRSRAPDAPILSYTFINAGHFPYERNRDRRPDRVFETPAEPSLHTGRMAHTTPRWRSSVVKRPWPLTPEPCSSFSGITIRPLGPIFTATGWAGSEAATIPIH